MKDAVIKTKTKAGRDAVQKALDENKLESGADQRKAQKMFLITHFEEGEALVVNFTANNFTTKHLLTKDAFKYNLIGILAVNGAQYPQDYDLMVS